MTDRRRRVRKQLGAGERAVFRRGAQALFVLVLLVLIVLLAHDLLIVQALAGVGIFIMAAIVLPKERISDSLSAFASGDAGERAHDVYCDYAPWRQGSVNPFRDDDRRGVLTTRALVVLAGLAIAVVAGVALAAAAPAAASATGVQDSAEACQTNVTHDAFLYDDASVTGVTESGEATNVDANTQVRIEDVEAFVRVKVENPNAYCVRFRVLLHPDIVSPADVGTIGAKGTDVSASWQHVHDFEADRSYTEVEFTLPPDSNATFAPSTVRTTVINFRDQRQTRFQELLDRVGARDDVEKHEYELTAENGSFVTVKLSDGNRSVEEYDAFYRVGENDPWRPVTTDSDDPVFKRTSGPDDEIQFVFNDRDAEVEFTANPGIVDDAQAQVRSLMAGVRDLVNFNFGFSTMPLVLGMGGFSPEGQPWT